MTAPIQPARKRTALLLKLSKAEIDYRAGVLSVNAVAKKHDIPESTLRREAGKQGWTRSGPEARQMLVATACSGELVANELVEEQVRQVQVDAAVEDAQDMLLGLSLARKVLRKLHGTIDLIDDPRDIKVLVEAYRSAIDTIRHIRSLAPAQHQADTIQTKRVTDGFAELQAAFDKVLGRKTPDE